MSNELNEIFNFASNLLLITYFEGKKILVVQVFMIYQQHCLKLVYEIV